MKNKYKALIKDLELQIDYLIGYAPQGLHWKREYHFREDLIGLTLEAETTPPEIRDKINIILQKIFDLRRNSTAHAQEYLKKWEQPTFDVKKEEHRVIVNDYKSNTTYYIRI